MTVLKHNLKMYLILMKHAYSAYEIKEDTEVLKQIKEVYTKVKGLYDTDEKVKRSITNKIKLYLRDLTTFDRDIVLENGSVILEVI